MQYNLVTHLFIYISIIYITIIYIYLPTYIHTGKLYKLYDIIYYLVKPWNADNIPNMWMSAVRPRSYETCLSSYS